MRILVNKKQIIVKTKKFFIPWDIKNGKKLKANKTQDFVGLIYHLT